MGDLTEEQQWVERSRQGDLTAFAELVRTHQQMIHSLTYRMTGSAADCKDLAQETFIRAFHELGSYRGSSKFSSWLYRIGINACLDWKRREQRREKLQAQWNTENFEIDMGRDFFRDEDDLNRRVQAALLKLPDKQRAAIVLTVYGGHNHAQVAKMLGCSETTISWRVFSARRKLRKMLGKPADNHE